MKAQVLQKTGTPLVHKDVQDPSPGPGQILVRVLACAVCRTDLHLVDGELPSTKLPIIPGHEIVGEVVHADNGRWSAGQRVGIPWLGWTCGTCVYCRSGHENLCDGAKFTGYTLDGGYAEYALADERYCFPIPKAYSDVQAAPLLCAGLIGYRCLRKAGPAKELGIYGFGAAAHIVTQIARFESRNVYAFTRTADIMAQSFARDLGATWAGDATERPPVPLDAAIIFAPIGALLPMALKRVRKGGIVVCGGIHMSDIPAFPYRDLWQEKTVCSVANLTRQDGLDFFQIAPKVPISPTVQVFPLAEANEALSRLRAGKLKGAAVLQIN